MARSLKTLNPLAGYLVWSGSAWGGVGEAQNTRHPPSILSIIFDTVERKGLTPVRSQTQFGEVRAAMAAVDAQCGRQLSGSRGLGTPLHPP